MVLAHRHRHGLRQFLHALFDHHSKRNTRLVIDDLDDANQIAACCIQYRCNQHLLGAVSGALVYFLQKTQMRTVFRQFLFIIYVLDIEQLFMHCSITCEALLGDGQLEVLEGIEPGLDLGNKRDIVIAHNIDRQSIRIK